MTDNGFRFERLEQKLRQYGDCPEPAVLLEVISFVNHDLELFMLGENVSILMDFLDNKVRSKRIPSPTAVKSFDLQNCLREVDCPALLGSVLLFVLFFSPFLKRRDEKWLIENSFYCKLIQRHIADSMGMRVWIDHHLSYYLNTALLSWLNDSFRSSASDRAHHFSENSVDAQQIIQKDSSAGSLDWFNERYQYIVVEARALVISTIFEASKVQVGVGHQAGSLVMTLRAYCFIPEVRSLAAGMLEKLFSVPTILEQTKLLVQVMIANLTLVLKVNDFDRLIEINGVMDEFKIFMDVSTSHWSTKTLTPEDNLVVASIVKIRPGLKPSLHEWHRSVMVNLCKVSADLARMIFSSVIRGDYDSLSNDGFYSHLRSISVSQARIAEVVKLLTFLVASISAKKFSEKSSIASLSVWSACRLGPACQALVETAGDILFGIHSSDGEVEPNVFKYLVEVVVKSIRGLGVAECDIFNASRATLRQYVEFSFSSSGSQSWKQDMLSFCSELNIAFQVLLSIEVSSLERESKLGSSSDPALGRVIGNRAPGRGRGGRGLESMPNVFIKSTNVSLEKISEKSKTITLSASELDQLLVYLSHLHRSLQKICFVWSKAVLSAFIKILPVSLSIEIQLDTWMPWLKSIVGVDSEYSRIAGSFGIDKNLPFMRDNFSFNTEQFVAVLLLLTRCNSSCESMGVGLDFLQELILKSYQADTKFGGGLDIEDLDVENFHSLIDLPLLRLKQANLSLSTRPVPPSLPRQYSRSIFCKVCEILFVLGCLRPSKYGSYLWDHLPSVRKLMMISLCGAKFERTANVMSGGVAQSNCQVDSLQLSNGVHCWVSPLGIYRSSISEPRDEEFALKELETATWTFLFTDNADSNYREESNSKSTSDSDEQKKRKYGLFEKDFEEILVERKKLQEKKDKERLERERRLALRSRIEVSNHSVSDLNPVPCVSAAEDTEAPEVDVETFNLTSSDVSSQPTSSIRSLSTATFFQHSSSSKYLTQFGELDRNDLMISGPVLHREDSLSVLYEFEKILPESHLLNIQRLEQRYQFGAALRICTEPDFVRRALSNQAVGDSLSELDHENGRSIIFSSLDWLCPTILTSTENTLRRLPLFSLLHLTHILISYCLKKIEPFSTWNLPPNPSEHFGFFDTMNGFGGGDEEFDYLHFFIQFCHQESLKPRIDIVLAALTLIYESLTSIEVEQSRNSLINFFFAELQSSLVLRRQSVRIAFACLQTLGGEFGMTKFIEILAGGPNRCRFDKIIHILWDGIANEELELQLNEILRVETDLQAISDIVCYADSRLLLCRIPSISSEVSELSSVPVEVSAVFAQRRSEDEVCHSQLLQAVTTRNLSSFVDIATSTIMTRGSLDVSMKLRSVFDICNNILQGEELLSCASFIVDAIVALVGTVELKNVFDFSRSICDDALPQVASWTIWLKIMKKVVGDDLIEMRDTLISAFDVLECLPKESNCKKIAMLSLTIAVLVSRFCSRLLETDETSCDEKCSDVLKKIVIFFIEISRLPPDSFSSNSSELSISQQLFTEVTVLLTKVFEKYSFCYQVCLLALHQTDFEVDEALRVDYHNYSGFSVMCVVIPVLVGHFRLQQKASMSTDTAVLSLLVRSKQILSDFLQSPFFGPFGIGSGCPVLLCSESFDSLYFYNISFRRIESKLQSAVKILSICDAPRKLLTLSVYGIRGNERDAVLDAVSTLLEEARVSPESFVGVLPLLHRELVISLRRSENRQSDVSKRSGPVDSNLVATNTSIQGSSAPVKVLFHSAVVFAQLNELLWLTTAYCLIRLPPAYIRNSSQINGLSDVMNTIGAVFYRRWRLSVALGKLESLPDLDNEMKAVMDIVRDKSR